MGSIMQFSKSLFGVLFLFMLGLNFSNLLSAHCPCGPDCRCGYEETGICNCCSSNNGNCKQCWGITGVYYNDWISNPADGDIPECCYKCRMCGLWMPELPPLFRPFIADPREVTYSAGWRFNDNKALTQNVIDVSYADSFPIYRWFYVWPWGGDMQVDIEGALWAVFDPCTESAPLMNADYYVGFPITYAIDYWQFRLRGFHISSHIGDEFLLNHPHFDRRNPSAEYVDFSVSHDFTDDIRLYGVVGYVIHQDESFKCHRFYSEAGLEMRLNEFRYLNYCQSLYAVPFFAMHFRFRGDYKRHLDSTYVLGYEVGKLSGLHRRMRVYMEYHDGYSSEGQFFKFPTNYFSIRASYGF